MNLTPEEAAQVEADDKYEMIQTIHLMYSNIHGSAADLDDADFSSWTLTRLEVLADELTEEYMNFLQK